MKKGLIILIFIAIAGWSVISCKKEEKLSAVITVQDMNYNNLKNATVLVYSSPNGSIIREELTTNESGQVIYENENKLILNVKATYSQNQQFLEGYGLIILSEDETYYETVYVN